MLKRTYIHTYINTYIQTDRQIDRHTYIHIHTHIHVLWKLDAIIVFVIWGLLHASRYPKSRVPVFETSELGTFILRHVGAYTLSHVIVCSCACWPNRLDMSLGVPKIDLFDILQCSTVIGSNDVLWNLGEALSSPLPGKQTKCSGVSATHCTQRGADCVCNTLVPEMGPPFWKPFLLPVILRARFWGRFLATAKEQPGAARRSWRPGFRPFAGASLPSAMQAAIDTHTLAQK
jgi:hypothetical protein